MQRFGLNYDSQTSLLREKVLGSISQPVFECNRQCMCHHTCPNRLVQNGPQFKLKLAHVGMRGFGLFAGEDIPRLAFVCEYAGEVVGVGEASRGLQKAIGGINYLIVLREHCASEVILTCIDPRHFGNIGRFINHSCDPNLLMVSVRVNHNVPRLALFARRDIQSNEELTFDYSGKSSLGTCKQVDSECMCSPLNKYTTAETRLTNEANETTSKTRQTEIVQPSKHETEAVKCDKTELLENSQPVLQRSKESSHCYKSAYCSQRGEALQISFADKMEQSSLIDLGLTETVKHKFETPFASCGTRKTRNEKVRKKPIAIEELKTKYAKKFESNHSNALTCTDYISSFVESPEEFINIVENSMFSDENISRKQCLCGSKLCTGYLPYDELIFTI